jgi:copper chaperone
MGKALFQITPLGCPGCGKQIEAELLKQSGVSSAKVFPSLGRIIMEFDEIKASAEDLESMIGSLVGDVELKKVKRAAV